MNRDVVYDVVEAIGEDISSIIYNHLSKPIRDIYGKIVNKVEDGVYDYLSKIENVDKMNFDEMYKVGFRMYIILLFEEMMKYFDSELEEFKNQIKLINSKDNGF